MNKIIASTFAILLVSFGILTISYNQKKEERHQMTNYDYTHPIQVGERELYVEVVNTPEKISRGLGGRNMLDDDQGMLFDFSLFPEHNPTFWMKDMNFAIDIIWVDGGKVVGIEHSTQPPEDKNSELELYPAPQKVDLVLETQAGYSKKNKIEIGDTVRVE